jgi:hypothetical protein
MSSVQPLQLHLGQMLRNGSPQVETAQELESRLAAATPALDGFDGDASGPYHDHDAVIGRWLPWKAQSCAIPAEIGDQAIQTARKHLAA